MMPIKWLEKHSMIKDRAPSASTISVVPALGASRHRAQQIASELNYPFSVDLNDPAAVILLVVDVNDAWLQLNVEPRPGPVAVSFDAPALQFRRRSGHNELLGRAVGIKQGNLPRVLDATAGLGRDAYVLADSGCHVRLIERSPVLAWLLRQAVEKASISAIPAVREAAQRMAVTAADSTGQVVQAGEVVYLDPMFPDRRQKAAAKKDLTLLQHLHGSAGGSTADDEAGALFDWAMSQQASRIVVKRGLKDAPLGGKPTFSLKGKAIRFDVYAR